MTAPAMHDTAHEDQLLGCVLAGADPAALNLAPEQFWEPRNEQIFRACLAVAASGRGCDPQSVALEMGEAAFLLPDKALHLANLAAYAVPLNAGAYAAQVREAYHRRRLTETLTQALNLMEVGAPIDDVKARVAPAVEQSTEQTGRYTFTPAGSFILDGSDRPNAVWGAGDALLAAEGEATILAGVQGCGKSTLAQQFALGRAGFPEYADLLDQPVTPGRKRVLYLAMDRPRQIARSLRRMVGESWRAELDERIALWQGPPPRDLAKHPGVLREMAIEAGADTVIVDSLKDAAIGLSDDEVGAGWNRARQGCLAAGIEMFELHHNRKAQNGTTGKDHRYGLDDIYGSTWITSGAGSVMLLTGNPGDPIVSLHHLKQPADELGPYKLLHDHDAGRTTLWHSADLVEVARLRGSITALDAARVLYDTEQPTAALKEKARRKLTSLASKGLLRVLDVGDPAAKRAACWGPA